MMIVTVTATPRVYTPYPWAVSVTMVCLPITLSCAPQPWVSPSMVDLTGKRKKIKW